MLIHTRKRSLRPLKHMLYQTKLTGKQGNTETQVSVQMESHQSMLRLRAGYDQVIDFCLACKLMVRQSLSQMGS